MHQPLTPEGNGNEKGSNSRFQRLKIEVADPMSEVHPSFFNAALPLFSHFNAFLPRRDPQGHDVYPMIKEFAKKLVTRFHC